MTTSFGSATPNPTSNCDSRPCKTFAVGGPLRQHVSYARDNETQPPVFQLCVLGSAGQLVLNPTVAELRQQRLALHRLVASLRLPNEEGGSVSLGRQEAAGARWRGHIKGA
jgi:hypothetical protein